MKHYLSPLVLTAAVSLSALASPVTDNPQVVNMAQSVRINKVKSGSTEPSGKLGGSAFISSDSGMKRLENRIGGKKVNPFLRHKAPVVKVDSEEAPLYESFEGWDGTTAEWLPEGWTRRTALDNLLSSWALSAGVYGIYPSEGQYMAAINYGTGQDEWLISPAVETKEGMAVSFKAYLEPAYLFVLDPEHVDFETMTFIGEREISATLQVMVKAEGDEDWTMLHDFVDDYKDMDLRDLLMSVPMGLESKNISLGDFAGKKIQVALRYVGSDGNNMMVDEVSVGYPSLEGVAFSEPLDIQYWGLEHNSDLSSFSYPVAQFPVFLPITWTNASSLQDVDFLWQYSDPATAEMVDGGSGETLSVTYLPDYSSENRKRNNLYYPPRLTASAQFATATTATSPYNFLQAGGRPEFVFKDGTAFDGCLFPFPLQTQGIAIATVDVEEYGDATLPIFGYDSHSDRYWLDYTFRGEEPGEGDDVKLDGILNFIYPSGQPMVVEGADVFAKGSMDDEVELTLSIFALDDSYVFDPDVQQPIATAKCLAKDIICTDRETGRNSNLCIPFSFDAPVVLAADENTIAYVVYLTGFNNEKVSYFAPMQSYYPNPDYLCHGWVTKRIKIQSESYRFSATPIANHEGEAGEMYNAFAIGLRAEYPWLTAEETEIKLPSDGTPVNVALGSYYDASRLNVEVPAGMTAEVTGRYDECVLTLRHDDSAEVVKGDVSVSGPGVEVKIPVAEVSGVSGITAGENDRIAGIYDLTGRRVNAAEAGSGIYIVRYTDGSSRKVIVK